MYVVATATRSVVSRVHLISGREGFSPYARRLNDCTVPFPRSHNNLASIEVSDRRLTRVLTLTPV